jgi:tyrosinase
MNNTANLFTTILVVSSLTSCVSTTSKQTVSSDGKSINEESPMVGATKKRVRYRKNIDQLTPAELAAYEHAVAMMKKKSAANIFDRTGFLWQAWVHNCTNIPVTADREHPVSDIDAANSCRLSPVEFDEGLPRASMTSITLPGATHQENPGMCEHAKDTFLHWHRAEFYFYEKALQAADPQGLEGPSTKDVTVPYWNFTKNPSGKRFPKVFEDKNSPLWVDHRATGLPTSEPYTSAKNMADQIYNLDWPSFGGYSVGGAGNYGNFETQIHNPMHSTYVSGYMSDNRTAGLDPLFYAFHSFLDFAFEKWIENHDVSSITGNRTFMRGEQDDNLPKPIGFNEGTGSKRPDLYTKNMGRAELYFDTRKQGYAFEPGPGGEFLPKTEIEALVNKNFQAGQTFGENKTSLPTQLLAEGAYQPTATPNALFYGKLTIPLTPLNMGKAIIDIVRAADSPDYSFQADVYLYPAHVEPDITRKDFRDRYLMVSSAYWALSSHHNHGEPTQLKISQDVTRVINSLQSGGKNGQTWHIALAVSSKLDKSNYLFSQPTIHFN